jgi:hypothetical protein
MIAGWERMDTCVRMSMRVGRNGNGGDCTPQISSLVVSASL